MEDTQKLFDFKNFLNTVVLITVLMVALYAVNGVFIDDAQKTAFKRFLNLTS